MTCAKVFVVAVLELPDGTAWHGTNNVINPQIECPREPGEGYEKCKTICQQPFHAEVDAITSAAAHGHQVQGGTMKVYHKRVCEQCQDAMQRFGVKWRLANA